MIRAVLAVLVAAALLGAALPALADARTAATADRLDGEAVRLERAAAGLAAASAAVDDPDLAARTTVTLHVPTGLTAARVDRIAVGGPGRDAAGTPARDADPALTYRVAGEPPRTVPIDPATSDVAVRVVDGPIALRTADATRLVLRLVDGSSGPTVRIARAR